MPDPIKIEPTKDVAAYAKSLMDAANITDAAQKTQIEAFLNNDVVKTALTNVLTEATDGIKRERGRVEAATKEAQEAKAASMKYYQDTMTKVNEANTAIEQAQARVAQYVAQYGELPSGESAADPAAVRRAVAADVIDKKTFDDRILKTESETIGLAKSVMKITAKHLREFPDVDLDPDAIATLAQKEGLTAEKAWEQWTQPHRVKKEAARIEAEKAAAIEAALLEANTKHGAAAVVDAAPRSEFVQNMSKQGPPPTALEAFQKAWNDPNAAATMKKEFGV